MWLVTPDGMFHRMEDVNVSPLGLFHMSVWERAHVRHLENLEHFVQSPFKNKTKFLSVTFKRGQTEVLGLAPHVGSCSVTVCSTKLVKASQDLRKVMFSVILFVFFNEEMSSSEKKNPCHCHCLQACAVLSPLFWFDSGVGCPDPCTEKGDRVKHSG